ncbi:HAD family hydrolase [Longispora fulva]|uniref:HAD family hydrolase n=1 Tax=Longispora fulva TaxID=619741 RepID=UPI001E3F246C|nr:HAD family phosphatase [Longispora fulva]
MFDLDGTLVDSESVWDEVFCELAGRALPAELLSRTDGLGVLAAMRLMHAELGWPLRTAPASAVWVERRVAELLSTGTRWRPGAVELLAELRAAGVPTALVTATRRCVVSRIPGLVGFTVVVCGDDVAQSKPHPEPYRAAIRSLGVPAGGCVAVEDTVIGATSAAGAGCAVLLAAEEPVPGYSWTESLHGVDAEYLRRLLPRPA